MKHPVLTKQILEDLNACEDGMDWFCGQAETCTVKVLKKLIHQKHYAWANWTIVRVIDYEQYVSYALFAAKQVIKLYTKAYPNNTRPADAIKAAEKCLKNPTDANKSAAYAAASAANAAAYAAAYAAYAANAAAYAAYAANAAAYAAYTAYAANAAADAAANAANAAYAAYTAYAAANADTSATYAAYAAAVRKKVLEYGMRLLTKRKTSKSKKETTNA